MGPAPDYDQIDSISDLHADFLYQKLSWTIWVNCISGDPYINISIKIMS